MILRFRENSGIKNAVCKKIGYACAMLIGGAIGVYTGILSQILLGKITDYWFDPAGLRASAVLGGVLGVFLGWRTARKIFKRKDKEAKSGMIRIISHIDGILAGVLVGAFVGKRSGELYAHIINYQDVPVVYEKCGVILGIPIVAGLGALAVNRIFKRIDRRSQEIKGHKPAKTIWIKRTAFTAATLALFGIYSFWAYVATVPPMVRKYKEKDILVDSPMTYGWFLKPKISPDEKRIVFMGERARHLEESIATEILVANSDGTNIRRLVRDGWNLNPFWINDEWVGFFQQHRVGNNFQWIPYKVSVSGGEISRLETKYPEEAGIRVSLGYYKGIEIARVYKLQDDRYVSEVYIDGKLNKLVQDWEKFVILPDGDRAAYTKKEDLYIHQIKSINQVSSIEPISEPVVVEGCSLLGVVEKGEYRSNIIVQKYDNNEIIMLNQDGEKISTIGKGDVGYRGFDLAPSGKSVIHAKEGDIWHLELHPK